MSFSNAGTNRCRRRKRQWPLAGWLAGLLGLLVGPPGTAWAEGGYLDPGFDADAAASSRVFQILPLEDGRVLICGEFWSVHGNAQVFVARLLASGAFDPTFTPQFPLPTANNRYVRAMALQPDGKLVVAGYFNQVNGVAQRSLARLNPDGSLDTSLAPPDSIGYILNAVAVQPDGGILIGGQDGLGAIARLHADGSVDPTFTASLPGWTLSILVMPSGQILVGGNFDFRPNGPQSGLVRLRANGVRDGVYDTGGDLSGVSSLSRTADGRYLVAGGFGTFYGRPRKGVGRLTSTGGFDPTFDTSDGPNGEVLAAAAHADGKVIIGGAFTAVGTAPRNYFARLNANGAVDASFNPGTGADERVWAVAVQSDGKALLGGWFGGINGFPRTRLARLSEDDPAQPGYVHFAAPAFQAAEGQSNAFLRLHRAGGVQGTITVDLVPTGGAALLGEDFLLPNPTVTFAPGETYQTVALPLVDDDRVEPVETLGLALANPTGGALLGADTTALLTITDDDSTLQFGAAEFSAHEASATGRVGVTRTGATNSVVTVRLFTSDATALAGRDYVAQDLTLTFAAGEASTLVLVPLTDNDYLNPPRVLNLTLEQPTGKATLGAPTTATLSIADNEAPGGVDPSFNVAPILVRDGPHDLVVQADGRVLLASYSLVRLQPNGEQDMNYFIKARGPIGPIALQPDGKLLATSATRMSDFREVHRYAADGAEDTNYNAGLVFFGAVEALVVLPDGKVLVGGGFSQVNTTLYHAIARLLPDGGVDKTFNPNPGTSPGVGGTVFCLAVQPDGKVVIGGQFATVGRSTRGRLARLNADGSLDPSFLERIPNVGASDSGSTVRTLLRRPDGTLLVGGRFPVFNQRPQTNLVCLDTNGVIVPAFRAGVTLGGAGDAALIYALARQADGRILLAGRFDRVNGVRRMSLARLHPDGALDESFDPGEIDYTVLILLLQSDGKVLVGGGGNAVGSPDHFRVVRLNNDYDGTVPAVRILGLALAPPDQVRLRFDPPLPAAYVLQGSDDLRAWVNLSTNQLPAGPTDWAVEGRAAHARYFYRVMKPNE